MRKNYKWLLKAIQEYAWREGMKLKPEDQGYRHLAMIHSLIKSYTQKDTKMQQYVENKVKELDI
jgi:hypothetical protein